MTGRRVWALGALLFLLSLAVGAVTCAEGSDPGKIYLLVATDGGICPTLGGGGPGACPAINDAGQVIVYQQCPLGVTQSCYTADVGLMDAGGPGYGACKLGLQTCGLSEGGSDAGPSWGPCVGEVTPAQSDDCSGRDIDCDGIINDPKTLGQACPVPAPPGKPPLLGPCATGAWTCVTGDAAPQCPQTVYPGVEDCSGLDKNCDGILDNFIGKGTACAANAPGLCANGTWQCDAGSQWCAPTYHPGQFHENCSYGGNDCDCNGFNAAQDTDGCCGEGVCTICVGQCVNTGTGVACIPNDVPTTCFNFPAP